MSKWLCLLLVLAVTGSCTDLCGTASGTAVCDGCRLYQPDEVPVAAEAEAEAEPAEYGVTVSFEDGELGFNGRSVAFPVRLDELTSLFGAPPRSSEKVETLHTWDELGIKAYARVSTEEVHTLEMYYGEPERDFDPRSPFRGRVVLPNGTITTASTPTDLRSAGLLPSGSWSSATAFRARLGASAVLVTYEDGVTLVSLSWTGFVLGEGGPPVTPDMPLFTARSQDYGFPFDEEVVEIERRGNVSALEVRVHDSGRPGVLGRSMFVIGSLGELAARLGYLYFVTLDGESSSSILIGFTNEAEPDIAEEFSDDYDPSREYVTFSNDFVKLALGGWAIPDDGDVENR